MAEIRDKPEYKHSGVAHVATLRVAANVADEETVTIGADVYEFDRADDGVTAGRIAVTTHVDDTPANATNALITAINASGTEHVVAVDISANEIAVFTADEPGGNIQPSATTIAVSETLDGTDNTWDAANIDGGDQFGSPLAMVSRVPTATEVALGNMHFGFPFTVGHVIAQVRVTASGAAKAWDGDIIATGRRVVINNDGATDWAATDTVTVIAAE